MIERDDIVRLAQALGVWRDLDAWREIAKSAAKVAVDPFLVVLEDTEFSDFLVSAPGGRSLMPIDDRALAVVMLAARLMPDAQIDHTCQVCEGTGFREHACAFNHPGCACTKKKCWLCKGSRRRSHRPIIEALACLRAAGPHGSPTDETWWMRPESLDRWLTASLAILADEMLGRGESFGELIQALVFGRLDAVDDKLERMVAEVVGDILTVMPTPVLGCYYQIMKGHTLSLIASGAGMRSASMRAAFAVELVEHPDNAVFGDRLFWPEWKDRPTFASDRGQAGESYAVVRIPDRRSVAERIKVLESQGAGATSRAIEMYRKKVQETRHVAWQRALRSAPPPATGGISQDESDP